MYSFWGKKTIKFPRYNSFRFFFFFSVYFTRPYRLLSKKNITSYFATSNISLPSPAVTQLFLSPKLHVIIDRQKKKKKKELIKSHGCQSFRSLFIYFLFTFLFNPFSNARVADDQNFMNSLMDLT